MAGIQGKNTQPEIVVRKNLFKRGYRYRINDRRLPGKPDLVLSKYNALILINGCFWHGHNCHLFKWPGTRKDFWENKIFGTQKRDEINLEKYQKTGWRVAVVWECAIKGKTRKSLDSIIDSLDAWLVSNHDFLEITGN